MKVIINSICINNASCMTKVGYVDVLRTAYIPKYQCINLKCQNINFCLTIAEVIHMQIFRRTLKLFYEH